MISHLTVQRAGRLLGGTQLLPRPISASRIANNLSHMIKRESSRGIRVEILMGLWGCQP